MYCAKQLSQFTQNYLGLPLTCCCCHGNAHTDNEGSRKGDLESV